MNIIINSFQKDVNFIKDCSQQKEFSNETQDRIVIVAFRIFTSIFFLVSVALAIKSIGFKILAHSPLKEKLSQVASSLIIPILLRDFIVSFKNIESEGETENNFEKYYEALSKNHNGYTYMDGPILPHYKQSFTEILFGELIVGKIKNSDGSITAEFLFKEKNSDAIKNETVHFPIEHYFCLIETFFTKPLIQFLNTYFP